MALTVETGANVSGAESYITVAASDTYHSNRGNTSWAALTTAAKEQALRKATDYLTQAYRLRWKGFRTYTDQALDWPRNGVYLDENDILLTVENDEIPAELKNAACELALKSVSADLNPDLERETASESVGSLSVSYFQGSARHTTYRAIDMMLQPFLKNGGSGIAIIRS